jgi:hypothetical protein
MDRMAAKLLDQAAFGGNRPRENHQAASFAIEPMDGPDRHHDRSSLGVATLGLRSSPLPRDASLRFAESAALALGPFALRALAQRAFAL